MKLKERLMQGECVYGTMVGVLDSPDIALMLQECGLDWFFFDAEHGYPDPQRMNSLFAYARLCGIAGLLRIPEINKTEVFRAMDMGVAGLIVPNVETPEQAAELVRLSKYAPLGQRGISMTRPHSGYRKIDALSFMETSNRDTLLIPQIESPVGIANLDGILAQEGIDGVLVGPSDLSQSLGIFGQTDTPLFAQQIDSILAGCKRHGKFAGIVDKSPAGLRRRREQGFRFLQLGSEVSLLTSAVRNGLAAVKE